MALESSLPFRVLKILESTSNIHGSGIKRQKQEIEISLRSTVEKITALLAIAESGINLNEITTRLRKLEEMKRDLEERQKQLLTLQTEKKEMLRWADRVADFFRNFEKQFCAISTAEQKVILRKLIERIVIDRENLIAKVFIWRLPKGEVTQIDQLINNEKRVFLSSVPPTRFELVFQA